MEAEKKKETEAAVANGKIVRLHYDEQFNYGFGSFR
jgi:hypothetical protein